MTSSAEPLTRTGRRPGRPRDPEAGKAILDATMLELATHGFANFTIDGVAARAGVSKATIYRRWPSKEALALGAASAAAGRLPEITDLGSVRAELIALYQQAFQPGDHALSAVMAGLIAESIVNDQMRSLLAEWSKGRRRASRAIVDRAIDRGDLPADVDADLLLELIAGALLYRLLLLGGRVNRSLVTKVVDAALRGVGGFTQADLHRSRRP